MCKAGRLPQRCGAVPAPNIAPLSPMRGPWFARDLGATSREIRRLALSRAATGPALPVAEAMVRDKCPGAEISPGHSSRLRPRARTVRLKHAQSSRLLAGSSPRPWRQAEVEARRIRSRALLMRPRHALDVACPWPNQAKAGPLRKQEAACIGAARAPLARVKT